MRTNLRLLKNFLKEMDLTVTNSKSKKNALTVVKGKVKFEIYYGHGIDRTLVMDLSAEAPVYLLRDGEGVPAIDKLNEGFTGFRFGMQESGFLKGWSTKQVGPEPQKVYDTLVKLSTIVEQVCASASEVEVLRKHFVEIVSDKLVTMVGQILSVHSSDT